jgi:hypothetical protein
MALCRGVSTARPGSAGGAGARSAPQPLKRGRPLPDSGIAWTGRRRRGSQATVAQWGGPIGRKAARRRPNPSHDISTFGTPGVPPNPSPHPTLPHPSHDISGYDIPASDGKAFTKWCTPAGGLMGKASSGALTKCGTVLPWQPTASPQAVRSLKVDESTLPEGRGRHRAAHAGKPVVHASRRAVVMVCNDPHFLVPHAITMASTPPPPGS